MTLLFLIPFFVSLYLVLNRQEEKAFLHVFLPCFILLPDYYSLRFPHLPEFSAAAGALVPISIAVLFRSSGRLRLRRMDLWVTIYLVGMAASEYLRDINPKDGLLNFASTIIAVLPAYIVGRGLIEPHLRLRTTKMIVVLLLCLTPFIAFEFRMGQNPWLMFGNSVFGVSYAWFVQQRAGHARIAASFGDTILAGIAFAIGLLMNSWLVFVNKTGRLAQLGARFAKYESTHIPGALLLCFLLATQSRGPMLSVIVGYLVLSIARFRNMRLAALAVMLILLVGGAAAYSYFDRYTSVSSEEVKDEQQGSAIYRRQMMEAYKPVVDAGGWLGYGMNHPIVNGQTSIDNAYLLIQLTQGELGFYTFLLIAADSAWTLVGYAIRSQRREDTMFAFCMLGSLTAIFFSLTTVFLGGQIPVITFMLVGWAQSLQDPVASRATHLAPYEFRKVLT